MRKNKQGISLIVLVITIIVMIILAAAIIISLENTGIINTAEQAVCKTNIKQAQNLAVLTWSNIYTKPDEYTLDNIEEKLKKEFEKNGLKYEDYNVEVSKSGIEVSSKAGCVDSSGVEGGSGNISQTIDPNWRYAYSYDKETDSWTFVRTNNGTEPTGDVVARMYFNSNIDYEGLSVDLYDMVVSGKGEFKFGEFDHAEGAITISEGIDVALYELTKNVVVQEGITAIGEDSFFGVDFLESVSLSSTVKKIEKGVFCRCEKLTQVQMKKNSITTIGQGAFWECNSLEEIVIPEGVTFIDVEAFADCEKLRKVSLPNTLIELGASTGPHNDRGPFTGCGVLEVIVIPYSLTNIPEWTFYDSDSIKTINYTGTKEQWNAITIGDYNGSITTATLVYNYTGN